VDARGKGNCRMRGPAIPIVLQQSHGVAAMPDFDPNDHRMVAKQRWFEDFVVGERFVLPSSTQTAAIFAAF
jgi:hypothetical protein